MIQAAGLYPRSPNSHALHRTVPTECLYAVGAGNKTTMTYCWKSMAMGDFVAFQRLMGLKVVEIEGNYWGEVRPFFYRPLPLSQEVGPGSSGGPFRSLYCGVQYAVPPEAQANSYLNRLSFENNPGYCLDSLHRNWKRKVRLAAKEMVIRPISTANEFKEKAHPAYLSFYERTRYQVRTERRNPAYFARWTDTLYEIPNILILGGFRNDVLGGVSISFLLDRTLFYATFFCDDESLRLHLPDLMLHTVRESASASPAIGEIFASMYKGGIGLDSFYINRGARIVRQPAQLKLNFLVEFTLQHFFPKRYAQLRGHLPDVPAVSASDEIPQPVPSVPSHPTRPVGPRPSTSGPQDATEMPPSS